MYLAARIRPIDQPKYSLCFSIETDVKLIETYVELLTGWNASHYAVHHVSIDLE